MSWWSVSFRILVALLTLPSLALAQTDWEDGAPSDAADPADPALAESEAVPPPPPPATTPPPPSDAAPAASAASPAAATTIVVTTDTPAPEPLPKESRRTHDGFYARVAIGPSAATTRFTKGWLEHPRVTGTGAAFDLLLGGTPAKGLVVGGGLLYNSVSSNDNDLRRAGAAPSPDEDPSIGIFAIGPFVDFYPNRKRGLHFGGMLALSGMGIDAPHFDDDDETVAGGGAIGLWLGQDWWVAREWSLGINCRYLGVATENADFGWSGAADTFTLSFTVVAH
ncbi:MAG: hypothetical protein JW751_05565 [Polyangiaceae bacterium]|nr:hypothetical protein [Polyangiaceae bacterium]